LVTDKWIPFADSNDDNDGDDDNSDGNDGDDKLFIMDKSPSVVFSNNEISLVFWSSKKLLEVDEAATTEVEVLGVILAELALAGWSEEFVIFFLKNKKIK
jgi:hypothetical protein